MIDWHNLGRAQLRNPELRLFESDDARIHAIQRAHTEARAWLGIVVIFLFVAYVIVFGIWVIPDRPLSRLELLLWAMFCLIPALIPLLMYAWKAEAAIRRSLRRQLNEIGILVCVACGFELGGKIARPCPKCRAADAGKA